MPTRGVKKLQSNIKRKFKDVTGRKVEIGLTKWGFLIGGRADQYTPIDTSALINSRQVNVRKTAEGWRMSVSYNQNYAAFLHENHNWKPKPPGTPGKPTGGYNPNATSKYLEKGAEEVYTMGLRLFDKEISL